MPEKQADRYIIGLITVAAFLASLAKILSEKQKLSIKELCVNLFIAMVAGWLFGSFACWLLGENPYAAFAVAGGGAFLGIKGIQHISEMVSKWIENKLK